MAQRKRRKFTPEFKAEAVRLAKAGDRSLGQVAKDLDLTETALRAWSKRARTSTRARGHRRRSRRPNATSSSGCAAR
jgi:transposase-like protein